MAQAVSQAAPCLVTGYLEEEEPLAAPQLHPLELASLPSFSGNVPVSDYGMAVGVEIRL